MKTKNLFFSGVLVVTILQSCSDSGTTPLPQPPTPPVNNQSVLNKNLNYDTLLNDYASLIAGIPTEKYFKEITNTSSWQSAKMSLDSEWGLVDTNKVKPIQSWLPTTSLNRTDSIELFYPFAAADVLYSNCFFPKAKKMVLIGLEPLGSIQTKPKADSSFFSYLNKIKRALYTSNRDGYFMTISMGSELHQSDLNGTLPLILFYARRQGMFIRKIEYLTVDSLGTLTAQPDKNDLAVGVRVTVCDSSRTSSRIFEYFSADISDGGLTKRPGLAVYFKSLNNKNVFLKAASYLLHMKGFDDIRSIILNNTASVLQDDSGLPYTYLNDSTWNIQLYGKYTRPIGLFAGRQQPTLKKAFDQPTVKALPFKIGYNGSHNEQHLILATKK